MLIRKRRSACPGKRGSGWVILGDSVRPPPGSLPHVLRQRWISLGALLLSGRASSNSLLLAIFFIMNRVSSHFFHFPTQSIGISSPSELHQNHTLVWFFFFFWGGDHIFFFSVSDITLWFFEPWPFILHFLLNVGFVEKINKRRLSDNYEVIFCSGRYVWHLLDSFLHHRSWKNNWMYLI